MFKQTFVAPCLKTTGIKTQICRIVLFVCKKFTIHNYLKYVMKIHNRLL